MPFVPWLELPGVLRDLDVNLAPLAPSSRFNEAKSAIKWLEAALVETPTVATPTGPFREAIEDGGTGLLATTPDEWVRRSPPCSTIRSGGPRRCAGAPGGAARLVAVAAGPALPRHPGGLVRVAGAGSEEDVVVDVCVRDEPWTHSRCSPTASVCPAPGPPGSPALGGPRQVPLRTARTARSLARRAAARS